MTSEEGKPYSLFRDGLQVEERGGGNPWNAGAQFHYASGFAERIEREERVVRR